MKKLLFSLIILTSLSINAQNANEKFKDQFEKIKSELNLSEEQEAKLMVLFKERAAIIQKKKNASNELMSQAAEKEEKMKRMKERHEESKVFKGKIAEILNEDQQKKMMELIPERKSKMEEERKHKIQHEKKIKHSH